MPPHGRLVLLGITLIGRCGLRWLFCPHFTGLMQLGLLSDGIWGFRWFASPRIAALVLLGLTLVDRCGLRWLLWPRNAGLVQLGLILVGICEFSHPNPQLRCLPDLHLCRMPLPCVVWHAVSDAAFQRC